MRINHLFFLLGISLVGLTSCSLYRSNIKTADRISDRIQANLEQPFKPSEQYRLDTIAVKDDIWLGNQSVRVNEGDPLPSRFETEDGITLVSTAPVSLLQISEQITSLTGITVRVDDMILNEVRSAVQGETDTTGTAQSKASPELFMPTYSGKLSGLLDQIASRFALWWRYKNNVISFYKMETRVFTIYALPTTSSLNANIAGTASGDSGGTTSASMSSSISLDFWSQLESALTAMLPDGATLNVIPTNGTVTVTAPPFTLQRISQYINNMNDKLSRQVAISVKVLNVTLSDENSIGLSVNSVLKFIHAKADPRLTIGLSSTAQTTSDSINMALLPKDRHIGKTSLIFEALNSQGTTSLVTSATATTLNNRIAPIQVSTNESYVEKIETTMNSDTTSVSITPAKINYGFTMEVLPRILDHGRLLVMFTMTLTQLESMGKASGGDTGGGEGDKTSTTVQLPKIRTRGFVQEIAMTSGQTLMLTGFEEVNTQTNKSTEMFGASANANKDRNVMVILLTPEVLNSPLSPESRMKDM